MEVALSHKLLKFHILLTVCGQVFRHLENVNVLFKGLGLRCLIPHIEDRWTKKVPVNVKVQRNFKSIYAKCWFYVACRCHFSVVLMLSTVIGKLYVNNL